MGWSKRVRACAIGAALLPWLAACQTSTVTVYPSGSGGGGSQGGNGPTIMATIMRTTFASFSLVNTQCQLNVFYQSTPATITSATLTAPGPIQVPLTGPAGGPYVDAGGWTYQAGQSYSVQVVMDGRTYTASAVAPGDITVPPFTAPGPIIWAYNGNMNEISVNSTVVAGPVPSAGSGSVSTSSGTYFPGPGSYSIDVLVVRRVNPAFGVWAHYDSTLMITDQYVETLSK